MISKQVRGGIKENPVAQKILQALLNHQTTAVQITGNDYGGRNGVYFIGNKSYVMDDSKSEHFKDVTSAQVINAMEELRKQGIVESEYDGYCEIHYLKNDKKSEYYYLDITPNVEFREELQVMLNKYANSA